MFETLVTYGCLMSTEVWGNFSVPILKSFIAKRSEFLDQFMRLHSLSFMLLTWLIAVSCDTRTTYFKSSFFHFFLIQFVCIVVNTSQYMSPHLWKKSMLEYIDTDC